MNYSSHYVEQSVISLVLWLVLSGVVNAQDSSLVNARKYKEESEFTMALFYYTQTIQELEERTHHSLLCQVYYEIGLLYEEWGVPEKAVEYYEESCQVNTNIELLDRLGEALLELKNYKKALTLQKQSLAYYTRQKNIPRQIHVLQNLIDTYKEQQDYQNALKYSFLIYELYRQTQHSEEEANALNNIGFFYKFLNRFPQSLQYFQKALQLNQQIPNRENEISTIYTNIGVINQLLGNNEQSLLAFFEAAKIREKQRKKGEIATLCNYISTVYLSMEDIENALLYLKKAIKTAKKAGNINSLIESYESMTKVARIQLKYKKAYQYQKLYMTLKSQLQRDTLRKYQDKVQQRFLIEKLERRFKVASIDKKVQNLTLQQIKLEKEKESNKNYLLRKERELQQTKSQKQLLEKERTEQNLLLARQSLAQEKQIRQILNLQQQDKLQKLGLRQKELIEKQKQKEIELLKKEKSIQDLKIVQQQNREWLYTLLTTASVMIMFLILGSFVASRRTNQKLSEQKKQIEEQHDFLHKAHEDIISRNEELRQQSTQIKEQRDVIEKAHSELLIKSQKITDSINYAQNIQAAILPLAEKMECYLKQYFIIYQPKDIVSGDFYWIHRVDNEEATYIAVVDCTGHGIPGAFMSLIGYSLLNEIVSQKRIYDPAGILMELCHSICTALKQHTSGNTDGMDICLCKIEDPQDGLHKVTFTGAKNPLYYVTDGVVKTLRGDRISIGGWQRHRKVKQFNNQEITLKSGDLLYLGTDGFSDTPNTNRDRFTTQRLLHLIDINQDKSLQEQKQLFEQILETYRQGTEQRDDITLLGIRL